MGETAVATTPAVKQQRGLNRIKDLLEGPDFKRALAMTLPKHLKPERFIRIAINATLRTPELLNCTQESLFRCLLDLSAFGLEPDGRRAHLIPFGTECTLILDYKGLVELARRSGEIAQIHADVVRDGDKWSYGYGTDAHLRHTPNLDDPDRLSKPVRAIYSFVRLKDGIEDFTVLSLAEVEKIRKSSRMGQRGPWVDWWDEQAKKTAFRRHSKWLPLPNEVKDAIERDDDVIDIEAEVLPEGPGDKPEPKTLKSRIKERLSAPASAPAESGGAHDPSENEQPTNSGEKGTEAQRRVDRIAGYRELVGDTAYARILATSGYETAEQIPLKQSQAILRELEEERRLQATEAKT